MKKTIDVDILDLDEDDTIYGYRIIGLVVAAGLLCAIAGAICSGGHECDTACKYGTEAVEVLEKYKESSISAEETKSRIDKLVKLLNTEEKNTTPGEEYNHRITMINIRLVSIQIKFAATGYIPYYEIDDAIKEIKENI